MPLIALIVALAFGGGGTVAAAQNDLPGEALYRVKLASERVTEVFAVGGEAKVEVAAKLAQRRADEIAALKVKAQTRAAASENGARGQDVEKFEAHLDATAERLKDKIARLETHVIELKEKDTTGTLRAASNLEAKVEVWADILVAVEESTTRAELKEKLMAVREDAAELKKDALAAQEEALKRHASEQGFEASARGRVKAAENKLATFTRQREEFLERSKEQGKFLQEEFDAHDKYYQEAARLVGEANAALEAKNWQEAWVKANAAFKAMVHFSRPVTDPQLPKSTTADDMTVIEAEPDKPLTDAKRGAAGLTDDERASAKAEAAAGAEAKKKSVTQELMREKAETTIAPEEIDGPAAKITAETAARAAQAITMENKEKLGPVVKEKIRNLALRADVLMAEGKYVEAAKLYGQIVLTVKAALNLPVRGTLDVKPQAQPSALDAATEVEVEVEVDAQ